MESLAKTLPAAEIRRRRSDARRAKLRPQVDALFAEFRRHGITSEVIGSYARETAIFEDGSDLDILVEAHSGVEEVDVWTMAWEALKDVNVDLVFASRLRPETVRLMKEHARG